MTVNDIAAAIWDRIVPGVPAEGTWWLLGGVLIALLLVTVPPLWRLTRVAVTIVHELGHATVGVLMGRRFTGFVVSPDMSGHAITKGPRKGLGWVLTLWAGYPAPALIGAVLVQLALRGWAGVALFAAIIALLASVVFTRSWHTVAAVLVTAALIGAIWWWRSPAVVTTLTAATGVFLILGAWRHLGAVASSNSRGQDPAQLALTTRVPAAVWNLSFALVIAACTLVSVQALRPLLQG